MWFCGKSAGWVWWAEIRYKCLGGEGRGWNIITGPSPNFQPFIFPLSFYPPLVPFRAREKIIFAVSKKQSIRNSVLFNIGNEKLDETFVQPTSPPTTPPLQRPFFSKIFCKLVPFLFLYDCPQISKKRLQMNILLPPPYLHIVQCLIFYTFSWRIISLFTRCKSDLFCLPDSVKMQWRAFCIESFPFEYLSLLLVQSVKMVSYCIENFRFEYLSLFCVPNYEFIGNIGYNSILLSQKQ